MIRDDGQWLALADDFASAAFDGGWQRALEHLARATGSRTGELIGLGGRAAVPFNLMTNIDPQALEDFLTTGGGDPALNPRVRAGIAAPELKVLAESDFLDPSLHRKDHHYREWAWPHDIPFVCLTTLLRTPELLIGLAVGRSGSEGHIDDAQRRVFATIAPHARAAVKTQLLLENERAQLLAGALEAVSLSAFVCEADAQVVALTPSAEALLRETGCGLQRRAGRLCAASLRETRTLQQAIFAAAQPGLAGNPPLARTLLLRAREAGQPLRVLDVLPLSHRESAFGTRRRALVVAGRRPRIPQQTEALLRQAFGLTAAEAAVALALTTGRRLDAIAAARGVGVGTIRAQVKSVFAKFGVTSQVELIAALHALQ